MVVLLLAEEGIEVVEGCRGIGIPSLYALACDTTVNCPLPPGPGSDGRSAEGEALARELLHIGLSWGVP